MGHVNTWLDAGALAFAGLTWLVALTFVCGRLYERVGNIVKRLEAGDVAFKEIRVEQTEMGLVLQELKTIKTIELQRLKWIETQVANWEARRQAAIQQRRTTPAQ